MKFYEMSIEERTRGTEMIHKLIGTKDEAVANVTDLSKRIQIRSAYDRLFAKLANIYEKHGDKVLALNFIDDGAHKHGITPNGKNWEFYMNNFGWTDRVHHCGTLYIEGIGCVFTSGTLARAFERILEN